MKRKKRTMFPIGLLLAATVLLGGCSANEAPASTEESQGTSSVESENTAPDEPAIEVVFSNENNLIKYSTEADENNVIYLSEIKNTGNVQLALDDISIEVNDPNGKLLGVVKHIYARPTVIDPGESAYICENIASGLSSSLGKDVTNDQCASAKCIINYRESRDIIPVDGEFTELDVFATDDGYAAANGQVVSYHDYTIEDGYVIIPIKDQSNQLQTVLVEKLPQPLTPNTPIAFTTKDLEKVPHIDFDSVNIDDAMICGPRKMFG